MVSGWFVCKGLVRFGICVVWVALGWLCLLDGCLGGVGLILGGTFGWFTVVPGADLVESKE